MATYFDHIDNAVNVTTSNFDPTNEIFTFLSYKFTDWCTKIGPNYAEVLTGHNEWEASIENQNGNWGSFETCDLQILLKGPQYRSGQLAASGYPAMTWINLRRTSSDYFQFRTECKPTTYTDLMDRSTWGRANQGGVTARYSQTLGSASNYFEASDFLYPRSTFVLYSDTPGQRYFAWWIHSYTNYWCRAWVKETTIAEDQPVGSDHGWMVSTGNYFNPLMQYDSENPVYRWTHFNTNSPRTYQTYGMTSSSNDDYGRPMLLNRVLWDYTGEPIGYEKDIVLTQYTSFNPFWAYEVGGRRYMAWNDFTLLPLD